MQLRGAWGPVWTGCPSICSWLSFKTSLLSLPCLGCEASRRAAIWVSTEALHEEGQRQQGATAFWRELLCGRRWPSPGRGFWTEPSGGVCCCRARAAGCCARSMACDGKEALIHTQGAMSPQGASKVAAVLHPPKGLQCLGPGLGPGPGPGPWAGPGLGSSCRSWVSIDSCCGCRGLLASPRASASPAGKWGSLFATSDYALWEPTPSLPRDSGDLVLPPRSAVIFADRCPQRCVFLWLPIPHSLPSGSSRRDALGAEPQRLSEAQKEPLRPVSVDLTREWKPGCSLWLQDWVLGVRTLGPHGVFRACRGRLHTWHFLPSVGYIRDLVESFTEADQGTGPPWG